MFKRQKTIELKGCQNSYVKHSFSRQTNVKKSVELEQLNLSLMKRYV